jgi:hypothetical protein
MFRDTARISGGLLLLVIQRPNMGPPFAAAGLDLARLPEQQGTCQSDLMSSGSGAAGAHRLSGPMGGLGAPLELCGAIRLGSLPPVQVTGFRMLSGAVGDQSGGRSTPGMRSSVGASARKQGAAPPVRKDFVPGRDASWPRSLLAKIQVIRAQRTQSRCSAGKLAMAGSLLSSVRARAVDCGD